MSSASQEVVLRGKRLTLSNLDKVLYPKAGFTKAQVIDYYLRAAPALLPHLRDRPLTLKRYPDGVDAPYFYEKNAPSHRPPWVKTAAVWSEHNEREMLFVLVQDAATLAWAANLADLELHVPLHRHRDLDRPDSVVFDLDPGAPADLVQCCEVGLILRDAFERLGLRTFAKVSGSKGLQLYVPLNTPVSYDETKSFARAVADGLAAQRPALIVSNMKKSLRAGKVLVDWSQNDPHKTTVCVYSLRARDRPTVSMPVTWPEIERCHESGDPSLLSFESSTALARIEDKGDLFAPLLSLKQSLPPATLDPKPKPRPKPAPRTLNPPK
ncbi:MAG TPA: non-homologous end-joining DNA ligase [Myxococcales bacterium]|nr:non-homologous end-joining DNA ligase [Myxococcales bacterium]